MPERLRQERLRRQKLSRTLLVVAIVATAVTVTVGSAIMLGLSQALVEPDDAAPSAALTGEPLLVSVGRTPGGPREWMAFAASFSHLQVALGRPVQIHYALDRGSTPEMVGAGDVDLAVISVDAYLKLSERDAVTLVAVPLIEGQTADTAVAVVAGDSAIDTVEGLRGGSVAIMSGTLASDGYAHQLFGEYGGAEVFFTQVETPETHEDCLELVAGGLIDATLVRRSALSAWPEGTFKVIAESPAFGIAPVVARADLDPQVVEDIRDALLSVAASGVLPGDSRLTGFAEANEQDYAYARELKTLLESAHQLPEGTESP